MLGELRRAFAANFEEMEATHLATAPGRVNLIGDHIDYNGLPVFPIALGRRVSVLFRAREDALVRVANVDERFAPFDFTLRSAIDPYRGAFWGNYVKAAAQGLVPYSSTLTGIDAVVGSDIPIAAGLSSSSALVVASALALMHANRMSIERLELMDMLAKAERYVGTEGGGMDQAVCLGAREGTATRIDFDPLRLAHTAVPPGWRFIVAVSLVRAEKSGAARDAYNQRTRECRQALAAVTAILDATGRVDSYPALLAKASVEEILHAAERVPDRTLARRFRHVVTEAARVARAEHAMRIGDIDTFGSLMSESHRSLRDDFAVSCPALDELTETAMSASAAGARLTGAGFGGCAVVLCAADRAEAVLDALRRQFFAKRQFDGNLDEHLFVAEPAGGAAVSGV